MANPAMRIIKDERAATFSEPATLKGTIQKSIGLVGLTIVSAALSAYFLGNSNLGDLAMLAGCIGGFVLALVTCFKPSIAELTSPGYAVFEGMALGLLSLQFERLYAGVSIIAVGVTFAVSISMLVLWKTGIITVTDKLRSAIVSMTIGIAVFYFIGMIASFFGVNFIPNSGLLGIAVALIICAVAAMNLLLDFDNIQTSVALGMPKYMEYFSAFALLLTLVWLYVEILRLVAMIMSFVNNNR